MSLIGIHLFPRKGVSPSYHKNVAAAKNISPYLSIVKKFLSYFWPQTKKVPSRYNGMLEVTWCNAKKILDSEHANYSYGSLQRVMETSLEKIDLEEVGSILLLGLGGGSVIVSLREKFSCRAMITAIDIDPLVIQLASDEFGIRPSETLRVIEEDALKFTTHTRETFDLIIVDLFIDDKVPEPFYSTGFCENLARISGSNASIIFNLGLAQTAGLKNVVHFFQSQPTFHATLMENIEGYNAVLLAGKNGELESTIST